MALRTLSIRSRTCFSSDSLVVAESRLAACTSGSELPPHKIRQLRTTLTPTQPLLLSKQPSFTRKTSALNLARRTRLIYCAPFFDEPLPPMDRLPEYLSHHLYLVVATVIVALIALAFELRLRSRSGGGGISANQAIALHNKGALVLDVRSSEEFAQGHIVEARNIALEQLANSVDTLKKYREKPVIVYCEAGSRSAQAAKLLKAQGFANVFSLQGGLAGWRQDNLP